MQTQLNKPETNQSDINLPETANIKITNEHLHKIQQRVAFVTVLTPVLGTICALGLAWHLGGVSYVEIGLLVLMYVPTAIGVEVGLHRYFSHRTFKASLPIRVLLGIWGSMAAQGPIIQWASNHRRHHQNSEQLEDPHSPYLDGERSLGWLQGLWHAHMGWLFHSKITNPFFYGKDLLRDPLITKLNQHYFTWIALGLIVPTVLGGLLTWSWLGLLQGLLWGGFVRIFLVHHITWSINSFAHISGSRPFATGDFSANNLWLVIPTFGSGWHNNHHAFPNSAVAGFTWWQLDLGTWFIRTLEKLGLVWDVHRPTEKAIAFKKSCVKN